MRTEGDRSGINQGQPTGDDGFAAPEGESYNPTDEELRVDLMSVLNAFDLSTPEEQERMLAEIRETGDTSLPPGQAVRGRQSANLSEVMGASREQGMRHLDSLEDAAQHIPGIAGVLDLLGQPLPTRDKSSENSS